MTYLDHGPHWLSESNKDSMFLRSTLSEAEELKTTEEEAETEEKLRRISMSGNLYSLKSLSLLKIISKFIKLNKCSSKRSFHVHRNRL